MWRGMMPCWDDPKRFVAAVRAYLRLCNIEILFALSYLDEPGKRALFPEGHRWHKLRAPNVYRAAFGEREAFCKVEITALGESAMCQPALGFYVPRAEALREWDAGELLSDEDPDAGRLVGRPKPSLYHSWVVPQTEFLGIGEPEEREVKYGDIMEWRRIESDRGTGLRGRAY